MSLLAPGQQTFPRRERLRRPREFKTVFERGRRTAGGGFICYAVRCEGQGRKLGLAVSRKVGGAVVRNRVKRFIREVYRTHRSKLTDDVHMVIVAKPDAAHLDFHACTRELSLLFEKGDMVRG